MLKQSRLAAGFPVRREEKRAAAAQAGDPAVSKGVKVFRGFPARQQIVIVDANCLAGQWIRLTNNHIEKSRLAQIVDNMIFRPGIQHNAPAICPFHIPQDLFHVLSRDDGGNILPLAAEPADPPQRLQVKGIFIGAAGGGRKGKATAP